jgi:hypothetical protein
MITTFFDDFKTKHPNAKLDKDGLPPDCPEAFGYCEHKSMCNDDCAECWNEKMEINPDDLQARCDKYYEQAKRMYHAYKTERDKRRGLEIAKEDHTVKPSAIENACEVDEPVNELENIVGKSKPVCHLMYCMKLNDIYEAKNSDYGDSFTAVRNKYPNAILIRLNDKLSRLEQLMSGKEQQVNDESIDDTLMDLANYAIMELVERSMENE